ncbi:hypothetical protein B0181_09920 [Moraxella caviae]|uniref:Ribbon-helix-helix protein CopG domain-containing protein n=1 Tax=Moraxella caviae TaxID=34060 RepID=A0A1S9ZWD8_9GAMM|nr:hypothetical protein [Moraxella caviae]OOR87699.1 hypothetical protein B0181_09920 [Moraxella caviae]STZ14014.1 Uncharacterised protein [Moraxella caviae]VEW12850.1 Uncharacterised protein [Moraxella caviae]
MPKIVKNPKTAAQIQKQSNERRGVKNKAFTLKLEDIEFIVNRAAELGIPQNELIVRAVRAYRG